ncbi:hypothetical protein [Curtobacterium sp. MCLR17_042]|uniref:hypothetical protein n=1 Tax=Curtobacterium sp. MCLR17_042 TaxID=2175626 RepID=UPI000DA9818B|nr:hypothetical protein [Curtobacterium sp. MCLR17_042]PZE28374.1 hypothetical protein DEJ02_07885 [Curtobacterium sp. MCLR17_042]
MARTNPKTIKTAANTLRVLTEPETAPPVSRLAGRRLAPPAFKPETGAAPEADGKALSRFGSRFRTAIAEANGVEPGDVDLGLIRLVEALSADHDRNVTALAAPLVKRTEHGMLTQVRLTVHTTMLLPWLANGRSLRRMGNMLQGTARIVTEAADHPVLHLPIMDVDGPDNVLEIVAAQRTVLELDAFSTTTDRKKDRIDSIVQFGVLDPPDVVLTQLQSPDGSAWVAQAAEGAQRYFSAILAMEALANRDVADVATAKWLRGAHTRLRDLDASDLPILEEALRYPSTGAAAFIPGRDQATWLEKVAATTPAAVAFQLLRTMDVNLVLAVDPDPLQTGKFPNPVAETIQEMIRGYHMPGKMKDPWAEADTNGLIAIGAIDELTSEGRVRPEERAAWFGETLLPWDGPAADEEGLPGNRLTMVTKMLSTLTVQRALPGTEEHPEDTLEIVKKHLKVNGRRPHPDDRAKVAAAQAIVSLRLFKEGWENTAQAALFGLFRHNWFWRTEGQEARWPELLGTPVGELADRARAEQLAHADDADGDAAGPAQRALAALGGVALMLNPGLIQAGEALSRTARGGGGKATTVNATDPSVLLKTMAQHPAGIDQLEDAIVALVASAEPAVPVDRDDAEILGDFYLRARWLGKKGDGDPTPENPITEFQRRIEAFIEELDAKVRDADELRLQRAGDILGLEPPEGDADDREEDVDLWGDPMFERIGIDEDLASRALEMLQSLNDFFHTGKAFAKAASRAGR